MSNRSCEDCKWNRLNPQGQKMIQCGQGHARTFQTTIEDCHAWKEKEKCWCEADGQKRLQLHDYVRNQYGDGNYQMRSTTTAKYCPICGKKLDA